MSAYTYDDVAQVAEGLRVILGANLSDERCAKMVKPLAEELLVLTAALLEEAGATLNLSEQANALRREREEARSQCRAMRAEFGAQKTWVFPWEED